MRHKTNAGIDALLNSEVEIDVTESIRGVTRIRQMLRCDSEITLVSRRWRWDSSERFAMAAHPNVRIICNLLDPECDPSAIKQFLDLGFSVRTNRLLNSSFAFSENAVVFGPLGQSVALYDREADRSHGASFEVSFLTRDAQAIEHVRHAAERIWNDRATTIVTKSTASREFNKRYRK